jgi:hypothetical protein
LKPAWANSSQDPISEKTQNKKRAGGVAQVVEHLPSKYEAVSSSHNTDKNKQKQQQMNN